ncbi:MAG: dTDP-4-dehydrorhamnose reductase [Bryobacterales bacterium]|nr:dTDP-4-dehydrorhamnose reductase [Bryobacterales bacterium]
MVSQMIAPGRTDHPLILGAKGMLGGALRDADPAASAWDREDVDVLDEAALRKKLLALSPSAIINCVAFNDVDGAEEQPGAAFALNAGFPGRLAGLAAELDVPLIHYSTNYVFDGVQGEYAEQDEPNPLSVYAASKREGELRVLASGARVYVLRTAVLFGRPGVSEVSKKSFIHLMLDLARTRGILNVVNDEINSITYVRDLAAVTYSILSGGLPVGIYHTVNSGPASWFELADEVFRITGSSIRLNAVPAAYFPRKAKRPAKSVLINTRLKPLPSWRQAVGRFLSGPDSPVSVNRV